MRIGVLARGQAAQLDWAKRLGFRSLEWVRFDTSPAGVSGATDKRGGDVASRLATPGDFLATIYRQLGIDVSLITIPDFSGRPNLILPAACQSGNWRERVDP